MIPTDQSTFMSFNMQDTEQINTEKPAIITQRPHFRAVFLKARQAVSFHVRLPKDIPQDIVKIEATTTKLTLSTKEPFNGLLYKMESDAPESYTLLDPGNPKTSWKKGSCVIRFKVQHIAKPLVKKKETEKKRKLSSNAESEPPQKKRKTALSTERAKISKEEIQKSLNFIEAVNNEEEEKRTKKNTKESEREAFFTELEEKKKKTKERKQQLHRNVLKEIEKKKYPKKNHKPKKSSKKVSFQNKIHWIFNSNVFYFEMNIQ